MKRGGLGAAEAQEVEVTIGNQKFEPEGGEDSGLAWQMIGGADYYFTEKMSAFLEYKYLTYEEAGFSGDGIDQHLVVLGLRWHF